MNACGALRSPCGLRASRFQGAPPCAALLLLRLPLAAAANARGSQASARLHHHQQQQHQRPCGGRHRGRAVAARSVSVDAAAAAAPLGASDPPAQLLPGFRIDPDEVQRRLHEDAGGDMDRLLLSLLKPAARLARPPVSNYHVGAVGLAGSGAIYVGVNLEFPGAPLSQSVHGEQFLLANLLLHGEARLDTLAISAAPCGHCRQFYSELAGADSVRFLFGCHDSGRQELYTLADLLPARFGPLHLLGPGSAPLLLEPQANKLRWSRAAQARVGWQAGQGAFQEAAAEALDAARKSYSPYTRCPSGVSLIATGGRVFSGGYVENAAHNPGLAPLQAAIVGAIVGGLGDYNEIEEVVIAELKRGLVQQAGVSRTLARAATRNGRLPVTVLHVEWAE